MQVQGYMCKRCGHQTHQKSNLQMHLEKQRICDPIFSDTERSVLLEELTYRNHGNSLLKDGASIKSELANVSKKVELLQVALNKVTEQLVRIGDRLG